MHQDGEAAREPTRAAVLAVGRTEFSVLDTGIDRG
jgi:hypothetical protein